MTEDNKKRKQYTKPNEEAVILKKHKNFLDSPQNGEHLQKIIEYGSPEAGIPSDQEWNKMTHSLMGVYNMATGQPFFLSSCAMNECILKDL